MDTYVYQVGGKNYINLTNRCNNACDFCIRQNKVGIPGFSLWLEKEPEAEEVIAQLDAAGRGDVVFCGYGEPTLRLDVLKEVAAYVKSYGGKVRVNTNGLANREYGRDVVPELENLVDVMSISLNEASAEKYDAVCHSIYGPAAFDEMLDFARRCAGTRMDTVLSVVDVISPEDIAVCREIAEKVGARLRVREYSAE
ncbi:radical SAM protein [Christensenellaceae bacterium NSJ-63]|uniref:Radical SAM protein n=1 Tax=Guopingia tenuis TaxID=2763656 RepID=A0A926HWR1_9FIRM|nr:TatD family nuclease-associated radical SAM protein [Guopingia tenuis]MBC8539254.1 radical SAM protein [Guopingia tenuis]MBS5645268.1 TatD family nuclease-associated radical SAM protein [Clostridiales bacterium]